MNDINASTDSIDSIGGASSLQPKDALPHTEAVIPRKKHTWKHRLTEWGILILIAVVLALVLRIWVVQSFYIPSGSMEPTLQGGDRILVNKLSYVFGTVHTGNIVVFRRPAADVGPANIHYLVKRVIGLPGQTISEKNGEVYINGRLLKEPWLPTGTLTYHLKTQKIPPGEYFVMGDNRGDSFDSRYFGPIPGSLIVGQVTMLVWRHGHLYLRIF